MVIDKKLFTDCIKALQNKWDMLCEMDILLTKYQCDSSIFGLNNGPEVMLGKLLEAVCEDKGNWISYFCYELDFGRDWEPGDVEDKDGKDIPLGTIDDLYNLVTKGE